MSTITRMIYNAVHCSEFDYATDGEHHNGTCTQTSAEVCLTSALGLDATHQAVVDRMTAMTDDMFHKGICSSNGAATVYYMAREIESQGGKIAHEYDYAEPLNTNWEWWLSQCAGINPILMQVANAAGAFDIYGNHFNAGVQYHAIAIVGLCDDGSLVVSDPNNPGVDRDFDVYPVSALVAMRPCGLLILEPHAMSLPNGWSDDGTTLHAPGTNFVFKGGMRVHALAMLASGEMSGSDVPLENEHADASGNRIEQTTSFKRFVYARNDANSPWQFFLSNIGASVLADEAAISALNAKVANDANTIAQLNAQVAALKAQAGSTPPPLPANKQALLNAAEAFVQAGRNV